MGLLTRAILSHPEYHPSFFCKKAENTLDFRKNPRFKGNTVETNSRFDRILLQNTYPQQFPVLSGCNVFGTAIYEDIALAASDHYGVVVEME